MAKRQTRRRRLRDDPPYRAVGSTVLAGDTQWLLQTPHTGRLSPAYWPGNNRASKGGAVVALDHTQWRPIVHRFL